MAHQLRTLFGVSLGILLFSMACTKNQNAKQSRLKIPDRREFPVNPSIQPCDNFYQYACSKVVSSFKLPENRSRHIMAINDSSERILQKKEAYLKSLSSQKKLSKRARSLRSYFLACMNKEARKSEEERLVRETVARAKGLKTRKQWLSFLESQILTPKTSLVELSRLTNLDNSDWYDLVLDPGALMSLPERSYYENKELMQSFEGLLTAFFQTLGFDQPKKRAVSVVTFEKAFAQTYPRPAEIRILRSRRTEISRAEFQKRYPTLPVKSVFSTISNRTKLRNLFPKSFEWLSLQLKENPVEELRDLYLFHALSRYMDDAYPDYYKLRFEFRHRFLGGPAERPDRQERCTRTTKYGFAKELDAELIEKLFPNFPQERFEALVEKIRAAMIERLEKNTWLSKKGKQGALKKMRAAKMQLVKPKTEKEWDFLPDADYNAKTPIANARLREGLYLKRTLAEFTRPRNRERWSMGPLTVNAYYSPPDNKFVMLQGILQYPFFDPSASDAVNLGAAGMVVGHELGHAIDDQGAKYDAQGKLNQWMSDKDIKKFQGLGKKLIAQYDKTGHNGRLTLGENIADVTGLAFAYHAAFPKGKGSLADKKAFFLQYGRVWCGVMRPTEYKRRLKTDTHAQTEVRVNEPLKHQAGFYEAYGCKAGDAMYLPKKERLAVW